MAHQNRQKLYTILDANDVVLARGYTVAEAAQKVMGYDGHVFEVRDGLDGVGFELFCSLHGHPSEHGHLRLAKTDFFSSANDRRSAEAEIFRDVIYNADFWGGQTVISDSEYNGNYPFNSLT